MTILILAATLSWWSVANAATDADLLRPYPAVVRRNEVVEFKPKANHHFSLEAPQKCATNRPVEATARIIKCQFLSAGETSAVLNVCDDDKTFCKPVTVALQVSEKTAADPVRLVKNETLNHELKKVLAPGFTVGTPAEIKAQAASMKKPVFVMVSTDWCPPCNEAKEYLLTSDAFKNVTKDWFNVYVDGDSIDSVNWEKSVPYKYYPSFVLLNSRMEEIGRYNGELRQQEFSAWTIEQSKYLNDPVEKLKSRVLARKDGSVMRKVQDLFGGGNPAQRHADEVRLLRWALDQQHGDIVAKVTTGAAYPELKVELLRYQLDQLKDESKPDKAKVLAVSKELVEATFSREDWAANLASLCEENADECKPILSKIPERIQFLNKRSEVTEAEKASLLGEEYFFLAYLFEVLKDKGKQKEMANHCSTQLDKLNALSRLKLARGAQQNQLACLEMAERFVEAEKRLKALVEIYPNEPTFMVRMARLYKKQKKLDQALIWLEKADTVAYGFNWFTAQMTKSDILLDLKREKDAAKVIETALEEVRISEDRDSRNQRVAARLRAAQTKIQDVQSKRN